MAVHWRHLWLTILWSLGAEGIYHLDSMQTIPAPTTIPADSLFGYSISYQPATTRLIISAPNADIGKVFDCKLQKKECVELQYQSKYPYFGKMWLGATVASNENFTMTCAPRFIETRDKKGTFGRCFSAAPNETVLKPLGMIKDVDKGKLHPYENYMDSFGWSVNVAKNGSVLVGGPFMEKGRTMVYPNIEASPKLLPNMTTQYWYKFNYGYSVTSGNFISSNSNEINYAMSSTYGIYGVGALLVSDGHKTWGLKIPDIHRPHVGSMFGAALASASLAPGQPQALLVGTPAYAPNLRQLDRGVVYIYQYLEKHSAIAPRNAILGKTEGGRFGSAIVSLGDLNGDGKDEVAIAAPYEDTGAVYIYSGAHLYSSENNIKELQKIKPSGFKTFGLSLAVLQDYDNNGCNELAIGAPESNRVMVLSCMAKIIVIVNPLEIYPDKPEKVEAEIEVKLQLTHSTAKLDKSSSDVMTYTIKINDKKTTRPCQEVGIIVPATGLYDPMIQYSIRARQLNSPVDKKIFEPSRVLFSDLSQLEVVDVQWATACGDDGCKPNFNFTIHTTIPANYIIGSSSSEFVSVVATNTGDVAHDAYILLRVVGAHVLQFPRSCELQPEPDFFKCQPRDPVKKNTEWNTGDVAHDAYILLRVVGAHVLQFPRSCELQPEPDFFKCQPRDPVKKNTEWHSDPIELDMTSLRSNSKEIRFQVTLFPKTAGKDPKNKGLIPAIHQELIANLRPDPTALILRGSTNLGNTVFMTPEELEENGKIFSHDYYIHNFGLTDWVNIKCEITMEKKYFIDKFIVNVDSSTPAQCTPTEIKNGLYSTTCVIDELKKNQKLLVMLPMFIPSKTLDPKKLQSDSANVTIRSQLTLIYDTHQSKGSINTWLKLKSATVPIWIIIIAVLVGIMVIGTIIFALYECGYFRRKKKTELRALRQSVYRQSVRRSQIAQRNSGNKTPSSSPTEKKECPLPETKEDLWLLSQEMDKDLKHKEKHPSVLKDLPEENEECKIKKKEQIIKGLQKNLQIHRSNQFLAAPAKDKYDEHDF